MIHSIWSDTPEHIPACVHTSAICARRASPKGVHSSHTAWKCIVYNINTPIRSVEQRCMYAKNVVTQPVNRKFIIFISKKTIPIRRLCLNSTINGILSSQIRSLRITYSASFQCRSIIKSGKKVNSFSLLRTELNFFLLFPLFFFILLIYFIEFIFFNFMKFFSV